MPPNTALIVPDDVVPFLKPFLPPPPPPPPLPSLSSALDKPFVTLTYATSLDSHLSLSPGVQTALSSDESKALTHYLRAHHDAILVGCATAIADDPGLNCRVNGAGSEQQPRPVVLDPNARWKVESASRVIESARAGKGKGPWIVVGERHRGGGKVEERDELLREVGGRVIFLGDEGENGAWSWEVLLRWLATDGVRSLMIEGGGKVINSLLKETRLVDSVIVTVAPIYLGAGGVNVSPQRQEGAEAAVRFQDVQWCVFEKDVVMAARPITSRR